MLELKRTCPAGTFFFFYEHDKMHGWEFAHKFSERIARFLPKNERFAHDRSFVLSDLSDSLMVAHFL